MIIYLLLISIFSIVFADSSSQEIQKNINKQSKEAEKIQSQIDELGNRILEKENQSNKSFNNLSNIKNKLQLTKDLINIIKEEKQILSSSIVKTEKKIAEKERKLNILNEKFTKMIIHLYKNKSDSYLDILLDLNSWDELAYKIKYLEILSNEQNKIQEKINEIVIDLNKEITSLAIELLKTRVIESEKKATIIELSENKISENKILEKIKSEKFILEKNRAEKKSTLLKINESIKELISNKELAKKREEELEKIRNEKEKNIKESLLKSDDFANLKGKLPWPVQGLIINKFGSFEIDGVKTNNLGIEIKTQKNAEVKSIHDGIVIDIDFNLYFGSFVIIDHGNGYSTLYGNLNDQNILAVEDNYIEKEEIIGYTSNVNENNETFGLLNFMIFGRQIDKKGNNKTTNENPENWIK